MTLTTMLDPSTSIHKVKPVLPSSVNLFAPVVISTHQSSIKRRGYIYRELPSGEDGQLAVGKWADIVDGTARALKSDAVALQYRADQDVFIACLFTKDEEAFDLPHRPALSSSSTQAVIFQHGPSHDIPYRSSPLTSPHTPPNSSMTPIIFPSSPDIQLLMVDPSHNSTNTAEIRKRFNKSRLSKECLDWLALELGGPTMEWDTCSMVEAAWQREKVNRAILAKAKEKFRSGSSYCIKYGP
ncbi:hypothetical protein FRC03_003658 [Tulasnella sp. 419]|nr:hypothetical protein FRC03_003658 [Tulasnella sp. 419]